jgi:hypothetical protein
LAKYGVPDIFNTDQGSQFTSFALTNVLQENGIHIFMDGRWLDNVFIGRPWHSLKCECMFLNAFETGLRGPRRIADGLTSTANSARITAALWHSPKHPLRIRIVTGSLMRKKTS